MTASLGAEPDLLPRRFGFWTGLFVVMASMVGMGILTTSGYTIRATGNHPTLLIVWAVGGVLALCGSLTLAELATAMPRVGGEYVFVREGFGPAWAFVYGWSTQLLGFAAPVALAARIAVDYILPMEWTVGVAGNVYATCLICFFTFVHCLGHGESALVQSSTTVFKMIALLGLALVGMLFGEGDWRRLSEGPPVWEQPTGVLAISLVYVMYGYTGWNGAVYLAGEIHDAPRLLPRCLLAGCLSVTGLYLLLNLMYAYTLDPTALQQMSDAEVKPVAELAAKAAFGIGVARPLSVLIGLGILATLSAFILTGSRVAFVMARDGLFPSFIGGLHVSRGTPIPATVLQGSAACALLWSGGFQAVLDYTGVGLALIAGLVVSTIFPLRRDQEMERPFRTPLYPLPPILFLCATAWMVIASIFQQPISSLLSIGSILCGFPVHALLRRRQKQIAAKSRH